MEESKKFPRGNENETVRNRINDAKFGNKDLYLEDIPMSMERLRLFAPTIKGITSIRLSLIVDSKTNKINQHGKKTIQRN